MDENKNKTELTDEQLEQVSGGGTCQPVSADSTTCYWLNHLVYRDDYDPLDKSQPQTCGNCFYFNVYKGVCTSLSSWC